jgi:hypothetical protein
MKSEKDLIRSKYESAYPNLFQNMTDSLDNESMAYGDNLNKNTKYKQGSTPQLISKMWDVDGLSIEYNKYINDINSCRDQIDNSKYSVLACDTVKQADAVYNKIYLGYQNFLAKWKSETSISSNKWVGHFDKLLAGQQVVQPVQNIIPQQIIPQNNEDLLKKIKEFEEVLKQAQLENSSLKDQLKTSQDTINDQKIVICDLREDKKDLKEKVTVQKVEIDHLKEDLSVQVEKVQEFTHKYQNVNEKYLDLKTHFSELVIKHHEFDDTYVSPIQLGGEND